MKRLLLALSLAATAAFAADTWNVDTRHSGVTFSVRNFFVPVEGSLKLQSGKIVYDAELSGRLELDIEVTRTFAGTEEADECEDMRAFLEDCFIDANLCMGTGAPQNASRQAEVASLYYPFVEANVIRPDQISDVTTRRYTARYE